MLTVALDTIVGFSKSRDVRCRQHAIFVLGNLASNKDNLELLVSHGCIPPIISFAFPGTADVQFQAVAALRGLATHPELRIQIVQEGGLEPLILAAGAEVIIYFYYHYAVILLPSFFVFVFSLVTFFFFHK